MARTDGVGGDPDFRRFWLAQTVSTFGSLLGALPWAAVVFLGAGPAEMAALVVASTAPAILFGLHAGAWVDRVRRRPLLIAADLGRAVLLSSLAVAGFGGWLTFGHLYAVAFLVGALQVVFEVAHVAYLPALVGRDRLTQANGRLAAADSVVETTAFSVGGWIVQLASASVALAVDAATFIVSALTLGRIRRPEPPPPPRHDRRPIRAEIAEGARLCWDDRVLRAFGTIHAGLELAGGAFAALVLVFVVDELGVAPGVAGVIFAVGGLASLAGASAAERVVARLGAGRTVVAGYGVFAVQMVVFALVPEPIVAAVAVLAALQLSDGFWTAAHVAEVSLRQELVDDRRLGRVESALGVLGRLATLVGTVAGGAVATLVGIRPALAGAGAVALVAVAVASRSPLGSRCVGNLEHS